MKFNIDAQTFRDLNIFTSSADGDAIYKLFRHTKTIGGREAMFEMMKKPSSDMEFLKNRTASIIYFQRECLEIDITNNQLDMMEHYFSYNKNLLKNNLIDAAADYLTNVFGNGVKYYTIKVGLMNFFKLFKTLEAYELNISQSDAPSYLKENALKIKDIITSSSLKKTLSINPYKLKFYQINRYDLIFRKTERKKLRELLDLVYELDVLETLAYIAESKKMCFANYQDTAEMNVDITGLYHPGIKNAVSNNVVVKENCNMTFLTGSNMAGKSSVLKAVGLSIYLSHIGFPIFANKMSTTIFGGLITTINLPDNLGAGLSHFYSEVKRVKHVADTLVDNKSMFVIFDELFRGTNVKDAFEASLLIISELTKIKKSAFFISTHIVELADELKGFENVCFKYMDTYFENNKPVFTYKLLDGISKERLGMYIVQNEGIIETIKKASQNQINCK